MSQTNSSEATEPPKALNHPSYGPGETPQGPPETSMFLLEQNKHELNVWSHCNSPVVSQVGGVPVPWIQRLPVPVWVRWLQTLQRLLRLPAPDPVHASYQGHAVPPERMLQPHLRQQVNDTCWTSGAVVATQLFISPKAPFFLKKKKKPFLNLHHHHHRSIQKEGQNESNTLNNRLTFYGAKK